MLQPDPVQTPPAIPALSRSTNGPSIPRKKCTLHQELKTAATAIAKEEATREAVSQLQAKIDELMKQVNTKKISLRSVILFACEAANYVHPKSGSGPDRMSLVKELFATHASDMMMIEELVEAVLPSVSVSRIRMFIESHRTIKMVYSFFCRALRGA